MKYNTFSRLKKVFPSLHEESCAKYFERLAKYLEILLNEQRMEPIIIDLKGGKKDEIKN